MTGTFDHVPDGMTAATLPPEPPGAVYECNCGCDGCSGSPHRVHGCPGRHPLVYRGAPDWPFQSKGEHHAWPGRRITLHNGSGTILVTEDAR